MIVLSWGQPPPTVTSLNVTVGVASQLSVAVAVPVLAGSVLAVHWMVIFGGHVIDGALLSVTVIVWAHVELLPQPSEAVQVRVMVSRTGQTPATVTSLEVMVGDPVQLSVAVAVPVLAGNVLYVH